MSSRRIVRISNTRSYRKTYSRLSWNTSRDHNNFSTLERLLQTAIRGKVTLDFGGGRDVRKIGSNSRGVDNIKETKLYADEGSIFQTCVQKFTSVTRGFDFNRRAKGWPIPPNNSSEMYNGNQQKGEY